jgi:hypothetical protein
LRKRDVCPVLIQEVEQLWAEKREKERRIAQLELELDQAGTEH